MQYNKKLTNIIVISCLMFCYTTNAAIHGLGDRGFLQGPYMSAGIGLSQQHYKSSAKGRSSTVRSNIAVGYSEVIPSAGGLYMAIEGQLGLVQTLRDKLDYSSFEYLDTNQPYKTKVVGAHNNLALLLKMGLPVYTKVAVYGIAGSEVSGFNVDTKVSGRGSAHKKSAMNVGLTLGAGARAFITDNVSFGVNYLNIVHSRINSPHLSGFISDVGSGNVSINNKKIKVISNAIIFDLAYHF